MKKILGFRSGKAWKKVIATIGYAIIGFTLLGIITDHHSETVKTSPAPQAIPDINMSAPVTPAPTPASVSVAPILSKEGISSNVKISILNMDTDNSVGDNQFSIAKAQGIFKILKLSITNNQNDAITVDSGSFKLIDDKNRIFSSSSEGITAMEMSGNNKDVFSLKSINPGMTIVGYIVYDVPKDAKGFTLEAHGGMMGDKIILKADN